MNTANKWIETAKLDLKGAKILYKKKIYPQSVFLFQQSVEKAHKALCLSWGLTTEEEVEKARHKATGIYKKIAERQKKDLKEFKKILNKDLELKRVFGGLDFEKYSEKLDDALLGLKEDKKKRNDIHMSSRKIKSIINEIKKCNEIKIKFEKKDIKEIIIGLCAPLHDIIVKFDPKKAEELKQSLEKLDWDKKEIFKISRDISNSLSVFISIISMAFITSPHSTTTRYPKTNNIPRKIYTKKLPLVKILPELMELHEEALKRSKSL